MIPTGTILNPSETAAVVGGNVLTSQRIVDVVLRAFGACAASQGCMNNITFGTAKLAYYETICGGEPVFFVVAPCFFSVNTFIVQAPELALHGMDEVVFTLTWYVVS